MTTASERLPFVVDVQWHPEYLPQQPEQRAVFEALVRTARARSDAALPGPFTSPRKERKLSPNTFPRMRALDGRGGRGCRQDVARRLPN